MSFSARASGDKSHDEIYLRFEQVENLTPMKPVGAGAKSTHDAAAVGVPASQKPMDPAMKQERTPASEIPSGTGKEDKI